MSARAAIFLRPPFFDLCVGGEGEANVKLGIARGTGKLIYRHGVIYPAELFSERPAFDEVDRRLYVLADLVLPLGVANHRNGCRPDGGAVQVLFTLRVVLGTEPTPSFTVTREFRFHLLGVRDALFARQVELDHFRSVSCIHRKDPPEVLGVRPFEGYLALERPGDREWIETYRQVSRFLGNPQRGASNISNFVTVRVVRFGCSILSWGGPTDPRIGAIDLVIGARGLEEVVRSIDTMDGAIVLYLLTWRLAAWLSVRLRGRHFGRVKTYASFCGRAFWQLGYSARFQPPAPVLMRVE